MVRTGFISTPRMCCWLYIICFSNMATSLLKIKTPPDLEVPCGANVTLTCDVNSSEPLDSIKMSWISLALNRLTVSCQPDSKVLCENRRVGSEWEYQLTHTLVNVTPTHQGKYLCKLHSNKGIRNSTTNISVQACPGDDDLNSSASTYKLRGIYITVQLLIMMTFVV
ncbi:uncharacterized protein [Nerophis lumbriciformis]|uniref:uncharacterized protein n=1 Tax=Nerophis lumbriciformis TaxID=546530 RepID=UPI003BABB064